MLNRLSNISLFVFMILLTACATEKKYRGVADPCWTELTGEQKQLIVDQAYKQDFGESSKK